MLKKNEYVKLNLISSCAVQLVNIVISLIIRNTINFSLGIEFLGIQAVFMNFGEMFTFALSGVATSFYFELYKPLLENDLDKVKSICSFYSKIHTFISLSVILLGLVSAFFLNSIINASVGDKEILTSFFFYCASLVITSKSIIKQYFIIANQRHYIVWTINGIIEVLFFFTQLAVVMLSKNFILFMLLSPLKALLVDLVYRFFINKNYSYLQGKNINKWQRDTKALLKDIKNVVLTRLGDIMVHNTDNIIISAIVSTQTSGIYSNYFFIYLGVIVIDGLYFTAINAKVGKFLAEKTKKESRDCFINQSLIAILINGFCVTCFYCLTEDFMSVWMGEDILLNSYVVFLFTVNLYLYTSRTIYAVYRHGAGLFDKLGAINILRGLINLALSIVLGIYFGLLGIMIATVVSNLLTAYFYEAKVIYKYFLFSFKYEVVYQFIGIISIVMCSAIVNFALGFVVGTGVLAFIIKVLTCALVALTFNYLLYIILKRIKEKILILYKI